MASTGARDTNATLERLSPDQRVQMALDVLRDGRIPVLDFIIKIFNPHEPAYAAHRDRLYTFPRGQTTGKLAKLLDVIYDDRRGREQIIQWMEPHAVQLMMEKVYQEMDAVKVALRQPINYMLGSRAARPAR
jgi:hypothetical protein